MRKCKLNHTVQTISKKPIDAPDDPLMGLIPTVDGYGRVAAPACRHCGEFYSSCGSENITIRFDGLRGRRTLKHRRMDAQICPAMPDFSQREIMNEAAALREYAPDETIEAGGDYALTVTMTQNAVPPIELIFVGQVCKSCRQTHDSSFFVRSTRSPPPRDCS